MKLNIKIWIFFLLATGVMNCKEVYQPKAVQTNPNLLVVDGIVVSGNDSTIITLSRTRSISTDSVSAKELGAHVSVVSTSGLEYPFVEIGNGQYVVDKLLLDTTQQFQLKIVTTDGNEFRSAPGNVHSSPPIDSVYWNQDSSGNVHVYLNTHDPTNNTRYYRWVYNETWEYHSGYVSTLIYNENTNDFDYRTLDKQVYRCYQTQASSNIEVVSTKQLSADIVNKYEVTNVPASSEKISVLYSDLVTQYAIPVEAYNFWQNLKRNTEDLGTLFDLQPFTELGNINCVNNPSVKCIGFISFSTIQQKRIFITRSQVFGWYYNPYYGYDCEVDTLSLSQALKFFPPGGPYFFTAIGTDNGSYLLSSTLCVDCTDHGGTTVKPTYWPY